MSSIRFPSNELAPLNVNLLKISEDFADGRGVDGVLPGRDSEDSAEDEREEG